MTKIQPAKNSNVNNWNIPVEVIEYEKTINELREEIVTLHTANCIQKATIIELEKELADTNKALDNFFKKLADKGIEL